MRNKDIALVCINVHRVDSNTERVVVSIDFLTLEVRADMRGLDERQQINMHALDGMLCNLAAVHGRNMYTALIDQPRAERQTFGGIVIAADDEHVGVAL